MLKTNKSKILSYFILWVVLSFISLRIRDFALAKINSGIKFSNIFISFYEVHNTGAAFNLFTDKANALVVAAVVCIMIITAVVAAKTAKLSISMIFSMSLLSSGMTLNTIDRIQNGYVTDYIYLPFLKNFPVFNIPDIMIVIGAFMLAYSLAFKSQDEQ